MCLSNKISFYKLRSMKKLMKGFIMNALVFEILGKQNRWNKIFMKILRFHILVGVLHRRIYYFWNSHTALQISFFDVKMWRAVVFKIFGKTKLKKNHWFKKTRKFRFATKLYSFPSMPILITVVCFHVLNILVSIVPISNFN